MASIRIKTAMIAAVPLLSFLATSALDLADRYRTRGTMIELEARTAQATLTTAVMHEMQKERGLSALYIGSDGAEMSAELKAQRASVDARLEDLRRGQTEAGAAEIASAIQMLKETRAEVWGMALVGTDSFERYTKMIGQLLLTVERIADGAEEGALGVATGRFLALAEAKELAGQERALGAAIVAAGEYEPERHQLIVGVVARQQQMIDRFLRNVPPEQADLYRRKMDEPAARQALEARQLLLDLPLQRGMGDLTGRKWVAMTSKRIDLLKEAEDGLAADLRQLALTRRDEATRSLMVRGAIDLGLMLIVLALSAVIVRGITNPLVALARYTTRLADGSVNDAVPSTTRTDEIGEVARAVEIFRKGQSEITRLREEQSLNQERDERRRRDEMHGLADSLEGKVHGVVQQVCASAGQITDRATGMGHKIDGATSRSLETIEAADRAAASIQMVASATEQLSGSITEIAQRVAQSSTIAQAAASETKGVNDSMGELSGAVRQISEIIGLIGDIASQTNLLALNATIEAARAGEAGKGFAVVAAEVKGLATQTGRAAEQVIQRINEIQQATQQAVTSLARATQTIGSLTEISTAVAAAVEQQGAATRDIAQHAQSVNAEARQVRENVIEVTNAAASSYSSAIQVLWSAEDINDPANRLRVEVDDFLKRVRVG